MNLKHHTSVTVKVGEADFHSQVLNSRQPVLVAFLAPWSRPCEVLASVLEEVAVACAEKVRVVQVNADDNPDLSFLYEIQSIPTLLCFVNGNLRSKLVGTASKEAIMAKIEACLPGDSTTPAQDGSNKI